MYKIPLTNSPNQTFKCSIPVNGNNIPFKFSLWYNYGAKYWLFSASNSLTGEEYFSNIPLLTSKGKFSDILNQLAYKKIGICAMISVQEGLSSVADDKTIGKQFLMIWGDNNVNSN